MIKELLLIGKPDASRDGIVAALTSAGHQLQIHSDVAPALEAVAVLGGISAVVCQNDLAIQSSADLQSYVARKNLPLVFFNAAESSPSDVVQAVAICTADPALPEMKSLVRERFNRVALDDFVSGNSVRFDLFVRIGSEKYLKIVNGGETLSHERLAAYKAKGMRFLYLRADDFMQYLGFAVKASKALAGKETIAVEKRMKLVAHTEEIILKQLHAEQISVPALEAAKEAVESSVAMLASSDATYGLLSMLRAHNEPLFAHSVGVSFLAVLIARQLGWTDPERTYKIAVGGLLHDIGMKELDHELLSKATDQCNSREIKMYESHTNRAMDILGPFRNLSDEIIRMVFEHHENPLGVGYPNGMRGADIHPFARVASVADEFCYLTLPGPNGPGVEPNVALGMMWKSHRRYPDHQYFNALLAAFQLAVDEKGGFVKPAASQGAA